MLHSLYGLIVNFSPRNKCHLLRTAFVRKGMRGEETCGHIFCLVFDRNLDRFFRKQSHKGCYIQTLEMQIRIFFFYRRLSTTTSSSRMGSRSSQSSFPKSLTKRSRTRLNQTKMKRRERSPKKRCRTKKSRRASKTHGNPWYHSRRLLTQIFRDSNANDNVKAFY